MERKTAFYLSLIIIGSVFALLTYIIVQNTEATLTILYITFALALFIRLAEEWRYYRQHNAPPASAFFIALSTPIALGGSYLAATATLGPLLPDLDLQYSLFGALISFDFIGIGTFLLFLNFFSLIFALPFFIFLIYLLRKYIKGRYPVIFVFRRRFPRETPIFYSIVFFILLGILWWQTRLIELSSLVFVIAISFLLIQEYVFPFVLVPIRRVSRPRVEPRTTRRVSSSNSSSRNRPQPSANRIYSARSTPVTSRSSTRISRASMPASSSSRSQIEIAPAINEREISISTRKERMTPENLQKIIPIGGTLTEDSFKCILCFQFPIESHRKVVICPYCKHPAHADELTQWMASSNLCSRCNKPISDKMIRISGKKYAQLLKMFKSNQLRVKRG